IQKMGGLWGEIPVTARTFFVATLAIAGIPPLAGFFSKDEILGRAFERHPALWIVGFITAGMTAFYMFRLVLLTFFGYSRAASRGRRHVGGSVVRRQRARRSRSSSRKKDAILSAALAQVLRGRDLRRPGREPHQGSGHAARSDRRKSHRRCRRGWHGLAGPLWFDAFHVVGQMDHRRAAQLRCQVHAAAEFPYPLLADRYVFD